MNLLTWTAYLFTALLSAIAAAGQTYKIGATPLVVSENGRHLVDAEGQPFVWIGCTAWGMTEWLSRDEVDRYLDDRVANGMNVVQLCLIWGKRADSPTRFEVNPPNAYGHRALTLSTADGETATNGPENLSVYPKVVDGGSPIAPNDYWDHVDYCLAAVARRGMHAAVLPVWGRRYINASHKKHSRPLFDEAAARSYGEFLGQRYGALTHLIWVLGGDVAVDEGGDHKTEYRAMVSGLKAEGAKGPMTYHPSGKPLLNSSAFWHHEDWLDFNMVQTFKSRDQIATAVRIDAALRPVKPTVLGEGAYEGSYGVGPNGYHIRAHEVRQQAYHAFFSGAAGFTYGGAFDEHGNGPLFGPSNGWEPLLEWPGSTQMRWLRKWLQASNWPSWNAAPLLIVEGRGEGATENLAIRDLQHVWIYFSEPSEVRLAFAQETVVSATWFDPRNGQSKVGSVSPTNCYTPPAGWIDAVLELKLEQD